MTLVDEAKAVREGEQLDAARLDEWLKQALPELSGEPQIRQFPGGASNLTYLISYPNRELVLRRPPFGTIAKSAHDMLREARVLQMLKPVYPFVPSVLAVCSDHDVMACNFFVMERLQGIIPRRHLPEHLNLGSDKIREMCTNAIDKLIELHEVDIQQGELQSLGKGVGYVDRQISGWTDRWHKARTEDAASFERVIQWLMDNKPEDHSRCVIHNDFRFDNLVYDAQSTTRIIGVLDWEMATIGDPLMDLGNSLAYWVEGTDPEPMQMARMQPTHLKGMLSREEVIDYYLTKRQIALDSFVFYEIYGLFRLSVIVQQIYYRYYHGQTKDPRFAGLAYFAGLLEQRCLKKLNMS